jgi:hypothetical protein
MSKASGHWLISTQVDPVTKVALPGVRPSPKTDAAYLLDQAYADAGTRGSAVFYKGRENDDGLWGAVLYKDRMLHAASGAHANAVVAYYKEWLPPWKRAPTPAPAASSSRPTRKRKRS